MSCGNSSGPTDPFVGDGGDWTGGRLVDDDGVGSIWISDRTGLIIGDKGAGESGTWC